MAPTTPDTLWLDFFPAENADLPNLPQPGPWALPGRIDHLWHRPAWLWEAPVLTRPSPATNGRPISPTGDGRSLGLHSPPAGLRLALVDRSGRRILALHGRGPVPNGSPFGSGGMEVHFQTQEGTLRLDSATFCLPPGLTAHLQLGPAAGDGFQPAELSIAHPGYGPLAGMRGAFLLSPLPLEAEIHQWSKAF